MEAKPQTVRRRGRPPRQREDLADTHELLLRAGLEVLTEKGFSATGIDEILGRAGVPKGSFYHYFASKEAFGLALIERYGEFFARKLDRHLGNRGLPPLERLQAFVDDARAGMARLDYRRGCLIGNLGQEMGALPESFRARLRRPSRTGRPASRPVSRKPGRPASWPPGSTPISWRPASGSAGKGRCCAPSWNRPTGRCRCLPVSSLPAFRTDDIFLRVTRRSV